MTRDTEKCLLSILPGVRRKRVNFRESIWAFCWDKLNCPYMYKAAVCIYRVSVEQGSTVHVHMCLHNVPGHCLRPDFSWWSLTNVLTSRPPHFSQCNHYNYNSRAPSAQMATRWSNVITTCIEAEPHACIDEITNHATLFFLWSTRLYSVAANDLHEAQFWPYSSQ